MKRLIDCIVAFYTSDASLFMKVLLALIVCLGIIAIVVAIILIVHKGVSQFPNPSDDTETIDSTDYETLDETHEQTTITITTTTKTTKKSSSSKNHQEPNC